jgi:hypothetical protein
VGLAQINALSNLAGFGTTYLVGFLKEATGKFSFALLPLVALSAAAALAIHLLGQAENANAVPSTKTAVASR